MELSRIPLQEALRYLGVRGEAPPELLAQVEQAWAELLPVCRPRHVWRLLERSALEEMGLEFPGEDLRTLLRDCGRVVLFALTLGDGPEALMRRATLTSPTKALILDACASAACEQACNDLQDALEARLCTQGCFPTDRFSPGYGDLPLTVQPALLQALDAQRRCGITLSDTYIMMPRKSVTAIFGLADKPQGKRARGCAFCSMRQNCSFRKAGITCA